MLITIHFSVYYINQFINIGTRLFITQQEKIMGTKHTRYCDICNKEEGTGENQLLYDDFVDGGLHLKVGDNVISCRLNIVTDGESDEYITDSVIDNYNPVTYVTNEQVDSDIPVENVIVDNQLEYMMNKSVNRSSGDICKKCFRGMVRLINDYASFNETVEF